MPFSPKDLGSGPKRNGLARAGLERWPSLFPYNHCRVLLCDNGLKKTNFQLFLLLLLNPLQTLVSMHRRLSPPQVFTDLQSVQQDPEKQDKTSLDLKTLGLIFRSVKKQSFFLEAIYNLSTLCSHSIQVNQDTFFSSKMTSRITGNS